MVVSIQIVVTVTVVCVSLRVVCRLVIVNLQKTPLDGGAALLIHAKCDDVMTGVMAALGLDIPAFRLHRYAALGHRITAAGVKAYIQGVCAVCACLCVCACVRILQCVRAYVCATGEDSAGTPFTLFQRVTMRFGPAPCGVKPVKVTVEPLAHTLTREDAAKAGQVPASHTRTQAGV